jgi:hypothetical protein
VIALAFAVTACGDKPSDEDCEKLLTHVVELYTSIPASETLTPQAENDVEAQKKAVEDDLGKSFIDQCKSKPASVVRCSLKARDLKEIGKCEDGSE